MPSVKPTAEQIRYLSHLAEMEDTHRVESWTSNPLAIWRATHPEGTAWSEGLLVARVKKQFVAMKAQGWVTDVNLEHEIHDDAVNTRRFEETLYRITERGRRALVESGNAPVITRRAPAAAAPAADDDAGGAAGGGAEAVYFSEGPADGRVVTLPAGRHDEVLFSVGGREVRYRRSRRPAVDGHPVFVPAHPVEVGG